MMELSITALIAAALSGLVQFLTIRYYHNLHRRVMAQTWQENLRDAYATAKTRRGRLWQRWLIFWNYRAYLGETDEDAVKRVLKGDFR